MTPRATTAALAASLLSRLVAPALAVAYDEARAVQFANLAGAIYCPDQAVTSWTCGPKCIQGVTNVQLCQGNTTKSMVAKWQDQCIVAFEGTSNPQALMEDLQFLQTATPWPACNGCKVHGGFLDEWLSMRDCVPQQLEALGCASGSSIRTTGHSLGAAVNSLAMIELEANGWHIAESYDFGMPRVGDEQFAATFNGLFGDRSFRVTHRRDPIVQLPPSQLIVDWHFEHKEPEVFYGGDQTAGYQVCTASGDRTCSAQYDNIFIDMFFLGDHLVYLGVQTSWMGCANASTVVV